MAYRTNYDLVLLTYKYDIRTKRICTRSRLSRASPLVRAALPTSGTIHFSGSQGSFSAQRPGAHGYARNIYLGTKFERR